MKKTEISFNNKKNYYPKDYEEAVMNFFKEV